MSLWTTQGISFDFLDDMTDDPIVTLRITTPAGPLTFMAQPMMSGTTMVLQCLHVQALAPNAVGPGNLMMIAHAVMKGMELDGPAIKGAVRSTGSNPSHRPRDIQFTRRVRSTAGDGRTPSPND